MKALLLRGASVAAVSICMNSWAVSARAAEAADAAVATAANTDSSGGVTVSDVVVVSEKRSQKLESVPVAVSAFTAETRNLLGIQSVQDLTDYTPGLSFSTFDNRPYIRGVGRQTDNLAVESGVAVYVDGVYSGANASTILQSDSLFIDSIEVLRGPQSTLYGRNADGGAINYVSKKPTKDLQAEVRTGYSNYDKYFIEGAASGPITDSLRFRIGGNYTDQTGGYYKNLNGPPEGGSVAQGGNGNSYHAEIQFDGNIGANFDWWTKVATSDYSSTYHTESVVGDQDVREFYDPLMPNQNYGLCGLPGGAALVGCAGNPDTIVPGSVTTLPNTIAGNPSSLNARTYDADFRSSAKERNDISVATTMTYHFPTMDLKYLFGYESFRYNLAAPWLYQQGVSSGVESYQLAGPATASGLCGLIFANAGCTQNLTVTPAHTEFTFIENEEFFSHELNLSSTNTGPVQWIAGVYWYHERYNQPINVLDPNQPQVATPFELTFAPAPANPTRSVYNEYTALTENSYAGFGQVDWKLNDRLKLTGGIRYTSDTKQGFEAFRVVLFNLEAFGLGVNTFGADTPAFDATACNGPYPGTGTCSINPNTGQAVRTLDATWHAVTGTANLAWTPDPTTLVYLKYSRGYKTGGFNSGIMAVDPETAPETVDAFETGLKKTIGRVFQANAAAFYYDYFNDQQPLGVSTNGVVGTQIVNLPVVHTYGFELEALFQPVTPLTLSLNYSYLSSTIANMDGKCIQDTLDPLAVAPGANTNGCAAGSGLQNLTGQTLPESPKNKISANALYRLRLDPGTLTFSGTYVWKDSEYNSPFNRYYNLSPSYSQVNLRATFTDTKNRYTVIVFADNVFNTLGYDGTVGNPVTNPGPNQIVSSLVSYTAPRTYGVEFQYRFK